MFFGCARLYLRLDKVVSYPSRRFAQLRVTYQSILKLYMRIGNLNLISRRVDYATSNNHLVARRCFSQTFRHAKVRRRKAIPMASPLRKISTPRSSTGITAVPVLLVRLADISRAFIANGPAEYGLEPRHDRKGSDGLVSAQIGPPNGTCIGSGSVPRAVASGFG
jgi:hypothetical protein